MARRSLRIQEQLTTANVLISDVLEPPATRKRAKVTKTENDSKPPESRKRTRKNLPKKTVEDEEDEYSDDMAPATKRRRVPEEYRKVRGRFGLLQKLVQDVPLEVILEIFCFLEPGDLLRLSRTSKELRGILMSRSTQDVWRSARENVQDLPPLPPDLNEPQYARLLEDAYCYTCKHKGRCETILWTFRARVCKGCLEGQVYDHEYLHQQPHQYRNLLPSEELLLKHSFVRFASNKITAQYRREFEALQTEEERQAWIELKKVQKPAIEKHAHLCRMWHIHKMGDRDRAIARIRRDRKLAILDKLEEIGWREEADIMDKERSRYWYRASNEFRDNKFINQPRKLTDKAWEANKADLVEVLKAHKKARLEQLKKGPFWMSE